MPLEVFHVRVDVPALEREHRKAVAARNGIAIGDSEHAREPFADKFARLADRQDLDEEARQLHDVIVRPPRMQIARADREAGAAIEVCRRIEIADGMDDMIETARHDRCARRALTSPRRRPSAPGTGW